MEIRRCVTFIENFLNTSEPKQNVAIYRSPLLRVFGIFFNHNKQPIFLYDEVREALKEATPKKAIIGEILRGYGTLLNGPLPTHITNSQTISNAISEKTVEPADDEDVQEKIPANHIERAKLILENSGWDRDEESGIYATEKDGVALQLSISLTTVNTPELVQTAERIAESWRNVGARVELKIFEPTDLTQSVIRPRRFDALLFGMVIGHELDLYTFWHSSQRNDPGLNIAQYADIESDALLENMRTEQNIATRTKMYKDFSQLVSKNQTAIFLYAPDFVYIIDNNVHNVSIHPIAETHERFDTVHEWHVETDNVWPFVRDMIK